MKVSTPDFLLSLAQFNLPMNVGRKAGGDARRFLNAALFLRLTWARWALAAAIFISWMNISGSVLANYWSKRPVLCKTLKEKGNF